MTLPAWMLLGFALWTLALLALTVGVHRWSRVLAGRAGLADFPADGAQGPAWYCRAMRAHANCVENLPVFASLVVVLLHAGIGGTAVDVLSAIVLPARIAQSLVHVTRVQTNGWVAVRFSCYLLQVCAFIGLGLLAATC